MSIENKQVLLIETLFYTFDNTKKDAVITNDATGRQQLKINVSQYIG